jgi:hypothetical protein
MAAAASCLQPPPFFFTPAGRDNTSPFCNKHFGGALADAAGGADAGEHHRLRSVPNLARSRQDLLNPLLGLPDGLSMARNGDDGVSPGRIEMWVTISDRGDRRHAEKNIGAVRSG